MPLGTVRRLAEALVPAEPRLAIVLKNVAAGCRIGLHTRTDVLRLLSASGLRGKASRPPHGGRTGDDLLAAFLGPLRRTRFRRVPNPGGRPRVVPDTSLFPAFGHNTPDLSAMELCRVVDHHVLTQIVSSGDKTRMRSLGIDFPLATSTGHLVKPWIQAISALPRSERWFTLHPDETLSQGVVWFTTAHEAASALNGLAGRGTPAEKLRDLLGLVHLPRLCPSLAAPQPTWLFLLRLPGHVAQAVGHYRPSFVEAYDNRRFMAASSVGRSPAGDVWGQAADLELLEAGSSQFDGARERVCYQIHARDLGSSRISFDVLGELTTLRGHDVGDPQRPDRDFATKL